MGGVDPVTLEVIRNSLLTVTSEMKGVVVRTAVSPLWKDAGDLSCGILTPTAELVAQGRGDMPVHLGTMAFSLRGILDRFPVESMGPGDVFLQNDPYSGGNTHLPDFLMAMPVIHDGRVVCFSGVRAHWSDIGGVVHSARAKEIFEEGIRVPPVRLYEQGRLNEDIETILFANTRTADERRGDMKSQYAGTRIAVGRIESLITKYGVDTFEDCLRQILDHSEELTREQISLIPDGTYKFEDYLDDAGNGGDPLRIAVSVDIRGSGIVVDFEGTTEQVAAGINNTYAATASAAYYVVKSVTDPLNPVNSGSYRPVEIRAPIGSLVNCVPPAPTNAYHETQVRICDALYGAFAQAVPDRVPAAGYGSQGGLSIIVGRDYRPLRQGQRFVLYEIVGGPSGGTVDRDGLNGTRVGTGNTGNIPVEAVELHNPLRIEAYEFVPNTAGPGRQRGGYAVRRTYRMLTEEAVMATVYERARLAPYGLFGGGQGVMANVKHVLSSGAVRQVPPKSEPFAVGYDDQVVVQTAGGGGYGNPFDRPAQAVVEDVRSGLLDPEAARNVYGVVLTPTLSLNERATADHRRRGRTHVVAGEKS